MCRVTGNTDRVTKFTAPVTKTPPWPLACCTPPQAHKVRQFVRGIAAEVPATGVSKCECERVLRQMLKFGCHNFGDLGVQVSDVPLATTYSRSRRRHRKTRADWIIAPCQVREANCVSTPPAW